MLTYSPFERPLGDLQTSDLAVLSDVAEGWYVEYKRECSGAKVAAKSLSAFANSYGGWLFYGIEESADGNRTAGSFPGIASDQVPQLMEWLQQAASSHVVPSPYFEPRVFHGPNDQLQLSAGRCIVVIQVPKGNNSPYLHSSGRFYRRVADASDPIHETDRHFLDLLWERGRASRDRFKDKICRDQRGIVPDQSAPRLTLSFMPDPWGERPVRSRLSFEQFASIMKAPNQDEPGVRFDTLHSSSVGFIARYLKDNDPTRITMTWEYEDDCSSRVTVPLSYFPVAGFSPGFYPGYESIVPFVHRCLERNLGSLSVIDLSFVYIILQAVMYQIRKLLAVDHPELPLYLKARVTGAAGKLAFLDLPAFLKFTESYGIPIIAEDECSAPAGMTPDTCWQLGDWAVKPDKEDAWFVDAAVSMLFVLKSFGIPFDALGIDENASEEATSSWLTEAHLMGKRATLVSQKRVRCETSRKR